MGGCDFSFMVGVSLFYGGVEAMAIDNIPYKKRTHDFLENRLRKMLNRLNMRDWKIELYTGEIPPKDLFDHHKNAACVRYDTGTLTATMYVNIPKCKEDDQDPLWNMYHEIFHVWLNYCDEEELQCNVLAGLSI